MITGQSPVEKPLLMVGKLLNDLTWYFKNNSLFFQVIPPLIIMETVFYSIVFCFIYRSNKKMTPYLTDVQSTQRQRQNAIQSSGHLAHFLVEMLFFLTFGLLTRRYVTSGYLLVIVRIFMMGPISMTYIVTSFSLKNEWKAIMPKIFG